MSPKPLQLHEGAILIGDAHYSYQRPQLLDFLKTIASGKIKTTQLILMGDIFDQLFGGIPFTLERNTEAVAIIRKLAEDIEVLYLEGNHDFQLASVFKNIQVFPLQQQPVVCEYQGKKVLLAHGDFGGDSGYRIYTSLIRSKTLLWVLRWIDQFIGHSIINWVDSHNGKKEDCNDFVGFEAYIRQHLELLDLTGTDYLIEGHHHQNQSFDIGNYHYINLAAFVCGQRYFKILPITEQGLLEEVIFIQGSEKRSLRNSP